MERIFVEVKACFKKTIIFLILSFFFKLIFIYFFILKKKSVLQTIADIVLLTNAYIVTMDFISTQICHVLPIVI